MSEKIAIDVVVLLPKEVKDLCIKINSEMDSPDYPSFKDGYNPHISLIQSCVTLSNIEIIKKEITEFLSIVEPFELEIENFSATRSGKFKQFKIKNSDFLIGLHKDISNIVNKYSIFPVQKEDFYEAEFITDSLVEYVNFFKDKCSDENFDAHITLGIGEYNNNIDYPIKFTFDKVGLFHLGRNGTCKEKLAEFNLN